MCGRTREPSHGACYAAGQRIRLKGSSPAPVPDRRVSWAVALAILAASAGAAAQWHGRSSRAPFRPPPQLAHLQAASVRSAADAFVLWKGSGINGRRVIVLTGRWSGSGRGAGGGALPDMSTALYWAAHDGLARAFDVVMPPAAFERRRAADASSKVFQPEDAAYRHDLQGFRLRFSRPDALVAPPEPALVLVEPTWFSEGAPVDPIGWLSSRRVSTDLVVVALDDPDADDAQRRAAAEYARSMRLPRLDVRTQ